MLEKYSWNTEWRWTVSGQLVSWFRKNAVKVPFQSDILALWEYIAEISIAICFCGLKWYIKKGAGKHCFWGEMNFCTLLYDKISVQVFFKASRIKDDQQWATGLILPLTWSLFMPRWNVWIASSIPWPPILLSLTKAELKRRSFVGIVQQSDKSKIVEMIRWSI